MFGLRDKVGGNVGRVAALAGDDDFRGAGEHVDGAVESDEALGGGDVEISGADNFGHTRNTGGSVGQGGDGVCPAETIELGDAEEMSGGKSLKRGPWRDDDDARDACDLRGDGGHEQGGRERMTAAGDVASDGGKRADELAGDEAGDWFTTPRLGELVHCEGADLFSGGGESLAQRGGC